MKFQGMWYWQLWWLCDEDEDEYKHQFILAYMVDPKNWPRPTWRSRVVPTHKRR